MDEHIGPTEASLFRGELRSRELPSSINLGELNAVMNRLWKKSIRHIARREVRECGGTLILDRKGKLKIINVTEGSVDQVILRHEVGEGETYVGTFHTHPLANLDICANYGLAFYYGEIFQELERGHASGSENKAPGLVVCSSECVGGEWRNTPL